MKIQCEDGSAMEFKSEGKNVLICWNNKEIEIAAADAYDLAMELLNLAVKLQTENS